MLVGIFLVCSWGAGGVEISKLNPIEQLTIETPAFTEPMVFNVTLPASYSSATDKRYFVIFDLHPRSQPYLSGMHDWLSHNGEWPWLESIIVNPANYHKEFAKLFEQTAENPKDLTMLNFLETKVLKTVDKTYRTNGFKIYSGFMSNGAIGLYALLNKPQLFNAYLISTPSLSNNFLSITEDATQKLAQLSDKMRFLYLSIGDHAYEKSHVEAVEQFEKALKAKAPEQLDWQVKTHDEHYYMSRPIFTVLNGIEKLFDDYHNDLAADSPVAKQGVDAVIAYYQELSEKKYGFTISAEGSLKNLAHSYLDAEPKRALKIYQQVTELYPDSAYAYADLAAAYQKTGQIKQAVVTQTIAVEKSANMIEWHQNKLKKLLTDYQTELQKLSGKK